MGKFGGFSSSELNKFRDNLNKLQDPDIFVEDCAKELAARLLRLVIKRTPVGDYDTYWTDKDGTRIVDNAGKQIVLKKADKKGGTLRRGWTGQKQSGANSYAESMTVQHVGNTYVIEIVNPVEYASYVEYGHRTRNHKGWVKGQFMMTISEQELEKMSPKVLEAKLLKYLKGCGK